jgi:class 3 adenylate cyclase/tetratricopeptide (TPR) repeat protein
VSQLLRGGERRGLSVLVLDIAGSSDFTNRLDPEDFRDLFQKLAALWQGAVEEMGGHVLKWTGDGLMAVFGYPRAHDNDAARAVAAALNAIALTNRERAAEPGTPHIRIGVHTGLALVNEVGTGAAQQLDITGDTPVIATRVEGIAEPDGLVISGSTAALVEREFELASLGPHVLKGIVEPTPLFRVVRRRDTPIDDQRIELLGRNDELLQLLGAWREASQGQRRVALLTASAGAGKSHLAAEFVERLRATGGDVIVLRCSELMRTTALYPVLRGLQTLLGWSPADGPDVLIDRLDTELGDLPIAAGTALVSGLLGVHGVDSALPGVDPALRRATLLSVMGAWVERRAQRQPCCLVVEDLHWADPSTAEFLAPLVTGEHELPLLVVATRRPEVAVPWEDHPRVRHVQLGALEEAQAIMLVEHIVGGRVPEELIEEILFRSDRIPLFIAELTRAVVSSGILAPTGTGFELLQPLSDTSVPISLRDSLMVQLDNLEGSRTMASIAATIGRTFDIALLEETASGGDVAADLQQMVDLGVLVEDFGHSERRFTFRHALVRDAAYQLITKRTRREWHGRIADALAKRGDGVEPAILAHHLTEAERVVEAVQMWTAAASRDFARANYDESIAHYERAMAVLDRLDPATRSSMEFAVQLGVGLAYATRFGHMSEQAEQAYQRADSLSMGLSGPESFPVVLGLWGYYQVRSHPTRRRDLAERCDAIARTSNAVATRLEGISALSTTLAFEGELQRALALIAEGIELYDAHADEDLTFYAPQHPVAGFVGIGGPLALSCGEFELADRYHQRLLQYAHAPSGVLGPFTQGYAHTFAAWGASLRGDFPAAAAHAQGAMAVANEYGFLVWLGASVPHLGFATAMLGDPGTGAQLINDGVAGWRGAGSALFISYYMYGLARAHRQAGDLEAALAALDDAIDHGERHAERFHLAELRRERGAVLGALGDTERATADLNTAVDVAAAQGARLFELRGLVDLVELGAATEVQVQRLQQLAFELAPSVDAVVAARALVGGRV